MIESSKVHELSFNQLQLTDQACSGSQWRNFGRFVARKAMMDEEYWVGFTFLFCSLFVSHAPHLSIYFIQSIKLFSSNSDFNCQTAAWLRAEAHWESVSYMR